MRILVVDDTAQNLAMLELYPRGTEFEPATAFIPMIFLTGRLGAAAEKLRDREPLPSSWPVSGWPQPEAAWRGGPIASAGRRRPTS